MARLDVRSQRVLAVSVGLVLLAALLPARWLGWSAVLADIVSIPIQPMADAGVRVGRWLRPADGLGRESEDLRRLAEELETTRALLHASRLTAEALLEEIEALQEARSYRPGLQMTPLYARVTGRSPDRARGPVRINAGIRHGVTPGATAIYRGGHLLGRVADDVSRLTSRVVPTTDPSVGLIEGVVLPAGDPVAEVTSAPRLQLEADGQGALVGDLDRTVEVRPGDVVRLADPSWADSAQGMIVGFVQAVAPKDRQPLRNTITVRPRFHAHRVASLTLIMERINTEQAGGGP